MSFHISYGCDFCSFSTCHPTRVIIDGKEEIACPDCWEELKKEYSIKKVFQKDGVKIKVLSKKTRR
ncbi:MAG TPA: hypothetical protein DEP48_02930 [Persephonella sp.]|uniref:hypothetical protein n=1 Tax=Persephonella TaxID=182899 RepID=UPI0005A2DCA7|nr:MULTISPECIES: hypothetical protein [Persephonella]HCB69292.1 hypothetical protein [Persephonella sp.]